MSAARFQPPRYNVAMATSPPQRGFATTRWSLVAAARDQADAALADLCRLYWYPLCAYVRRRGHDAAEAEDLTQAFFARLLEKNGLALVTPARGRFRSFLLSACQNFLANERDRANALKRGGGRVVSLDDADARYRREPDHDETPEQWERPLEVDHRADIYSLGVVFYELLTGELPLGKFAPPSEKVGGDVRLDQVVPRAMEKEPAQRYQQMSEMKSAVESVEEKPAPPRSILRSRAKCWRRF